MLAHQAAHQGVTTEGAGGGTIQLPRDTGKIDIGRDGKSNVIDTTTVDVGEYTTVKLRMFC